ncbi:hypothetical protein [Streptomyces sp. NPDC020298]|uniref:hypothetical protein n=1 Tax=unclassified Streptomyces TaxID=2593676 RepID=UPI0033E3D568
MDAPAHEIARRALGQLVGGGGRCGELAQGCLDGAQLAAKAIGPFVQSRQRGAAGRASCVDAVQLAA